MSKMLTRLLAVAALLCTTGIASATQFPNATCTDSVTITQIKSTNACKPALADTVRGVAGIIVGFDPIATGFDAFIQNSQGGPFTGIDFFTHSSNTKSAPFNFAVGDSIVVEFAKVDNFQGDVEIDAPNGSFGSPNFIVRKVSSGNALPPFFVGTTTQLKELPTNTFFDQYVGSLIKINGPMTVVRTSLTGGLGQNNAFLVINPSAPSDSVFIDGNKLTTFGPPAVGTSVFSVQGIGNDATRGYRIMLRDGNDIVLNTPPNVADAYPLTDNTILVKFDRNVTAASATNTSNYSLASFGSVNSAVMSGQAAVVLNITNGLGHGDLETVTVNGVVGLAAGQAMTTPQSRTFVNGVLTAAEIQQANPDSLAATNPPCLDRSRFAGGGGQISQGNVGTRATMAAVASARYGSITYMMDPGNPNRGGVAAFAPPTVLTLGDTYRLVGQVQEFFGETEFSNIIDATDIAAGTGAPSGVNITVAQAARDTCDYTNTVSDGEDYEGRLVKVLRVKRFAIAGQSAPLNGFWCAPLGVNASTTGDGVFVENFNGVLGANDSLNGNYLALNSAADISGVLHYESGRFCICPRAASDIHVIHSTPVNMLMQTMLETELTAVTQCAALSDSAFSPSPLSWTGTSSDTAFALSVRGVVGPDSLVMTVHGSLAGSPGSTAVVNCTGSGHAGASFTINSNTTWTWDAAADDYTSYSFTGALNVLGSGPAAVRFGLRQGASEDRLKINWKAITTGTEIVVGVGIGVLVGVGSGVLTGVVTGVAATDAALSISDHLTKTGTAIAAPPFPPAPPHASSYNTLGRSFSVVEPNGRLAGDGFTGEYVSNGTYSNGTFSGTIARLQGPFTTEWAFGKHFTETCTVPHALCDAAPWPRREPNQAELAAGFVSVRPAVTDLGRIANHLDLVFGGPPGGSTFTVGTDFFIGTDASNALGYDSVYVFQGTYPVDFSRFPIYGELDVAARKVGAHALAGANGGESPRTLALLPPHPNPASSGMKVEFELPTDRAVHVELYDLAGRLVRRLVPLGTYSAGRHVVQWDGRNDARHVVEPGVYMVRMVSGASTMTRRVIVVF